MDNNIYETPLCGRYSSKEMQELWSNNSRYSTWRKLWVILAKVEKELGIDISDDAIQEMENNIYNIDYEIVKQAEKRCKHDVMAHIYEFGLKAPKAKPIIHLGATSCYVTDNTEVILMDKALNIIKTKLLKVIKNLRDFANTYKDLPCLGYTHFQAAQLTTVGKRACLWIQDLVEDYEYLEYIQNNLKLLGCKGTTGTQESFMKLFRDDSKVKQLDVRIAEKLGFPKCFDVSGQTYTRKQDSKVLGLLSQIAQSATKFANDLRLLQHEKELEEPFEDKQIGSSAMAYKRNPIRAERMTALARHVISLNVDTSVTACTQWLERTLDDSANRRISISEGFLAVDGILEVYMNITQNIKVYDNVINSNIMKEIPFMATEEILMNAVLKGGDRQELHEKIREHSMNSALNVKKYGKENDLVDRIANDSSFNLEREEIIEILNPSNLCGRAKNQVIEYLDNVVNPLLDEYSDIIKTDNVELDI